MALKLLSWGRGVVTCKNSLNRLLLSALLVYSITVYPSLFYSMLCDHTILDCVIYTYIYICIIQCHIMFYRIVIYGITSHYVISWSTGFYFIVYTTLRHTKHHIPLHDAELQYMLLYTMFYILCYGTSHLYIVFYRSILHYIILCYFV